MTKKGFVFQIVVFLLLVVSFSGCMFLDNDSGDAIPDGLYVSINGDKQFSSIQTAIDAAAENETVYVFPGVYNETIKINKTITLMGQNAETTIIDGNNSGNVIIVINTERCNIKGFTIRNSGPSHSGIDLKAPYNNISDNIIKNNHYGIYSRDFDSNYVCKNIFEYNDEYGIYLQSSNSNWILKNIFKNNDCAMRVKARYNVITKNLFENNSQGLYFCCFAERNQVYRNNFINNTESQAIDNVDGATWYNVEEKQGNYWDDYTGKDIDGDGIGETSYNVNFQGTEQDRYPLVNQWPIT